MKGGCKHSASRVWPGTAVISALARLRQEDSTEWKASLNYICRFCVKKQKSKAKQSKTNTPY